ncbi:MAG TPA: hypothetical protein VGE43_19540 [Acidimicrobiales bacterium]
MTTDRHVATISTTDLDELGRTVLAIASASPGPLTIQHTRLGLAVYRPADPAQLQLVDIDDRLAGHVPPPAA